MSKKYKKQNNKILYTIIIIGLFLVFTFLFDKESYINLKNSILREINEVKDIVKGSLASIDENKNNDELKMELNSPLTVLFLNVGQAESILVKSDNHYMLIDAGNNVDGKKIVAFLKSINVSEFDYVFGTHAHEDHIGGLDNIIKNFKINNFYMPSDVTTTTTFLEVLNALEKKEIKFQTPVIGTKLMLGNSEIEVMSVKENQEDLNDTSIVLKLTYKNISILFTGDITSNTEKELLNKNIESTVLKVAHHGSKYSNSAAFLRKVNPKYAVISCGINNEYFHPHQVVLDKLEKLNTKVYRTDLLGTIVLESDGESISFKNIDTNTDGG